MKRNKRIRSRLLILLWIWAACMFLVVDLFRNVAEFDSVRPRARWYRAARYAAHKMVDEPYRDGGFAEELPAPPKPTRAELTRTRQRALQNALDVVKEAEKGRSFAALDKLATTGHDTRVRIHAMRALTRVFGKEARAPLLKAVHNDRERDRVRAEAARLVGRTGAGAIHAVLDLIQEDDLRETVKAGAVRALGEVGTAEAAHRALDMARAEPSVLQVAAVQAIENMSNPEAGQILAQALRDESVDEKVRVAACKALAASKSLAAIQPLTDVLADRRVPTVVRAKAAEGLGKMGYVHALPAVTAAAKDKSSEVARQARIAVTRLEHLH